MLAYSDWPATNMWCPQTRKPMTAIAKLANATKSYPKMSLRAKRVTSSLTTPMPGKNHDVHGGMRVEPEQMLKQQRIAAQRRIEDADAGQPFDGNQHQRDRQHRRGQHQNDAASRNATR